MNFLSPDTIDWARHNLGDLLLIAAVAYLLLLVLFVFLWIRQNQIVGRQRKLLRGIDGASLETMLHDYAATMDATRNQITRLEQQGENHDQCLQQCLQHVGVVRYDAFDDVGGEQSFSVALLDAHGSGMVISGLYSRSSMRVYAKPVEKRTSPVALSTEEQQAITQAQNSPDAK